MHKAVLMFISQILPSRRETESFQFCTFVSKKIEKNISLSYVTNLLSKQKIVLFPMTVIITYTF